MTLALSTGAALGWGDEGHKIVCEIAFGLLTEDEQREVKKLLHELALPEEKSYAHLSTACTFADTARSKARGHAEAVREGVSTTAARLAPWSRFARLDRWHFLNVEREARHLPDGACTDCVLAAIAFDRDRLADRSLPPSTRGEALALLGHWVADAHQPLHVSYEDDRGGNEINRLTGVYSSSRNLHDVWDNGILARARTARGLRNWQAYARLLDRGIDLADRARWEAAEPRTWADESYVLVTEKRFLYCRWENGACRAMGKERQLDGSYQTRFQPVVERRLQQAAVRLASTIAQALRAP